MDCSTIFSQREAEKILPECVHNNAISCLSECSAFRGNEYILPEKKWMNKRIHPNPECVHSDLISRKGHFVRIDGLSWEGKYRTHFIWTLGDRQETVHLFLHRFLLTSRTLRQKISFKQWKMAPPWSWSLCSKDSLQNDQSWSSGEQSRWLYFPGKWKDPGVLRLKCILWLVLSHEARMRTWWTRKRCFQPFYQICFSLWLTYRESKQSGKNKIKN